MDFKWKCYSCHHENIEKDFKYVYSEGKQVELICPACGNPSWVEMKMNTYHPTARGTNNEFLLKGQRCFNCPFYKCLRSGWEYGNEEGICTLDADYLDNGYKDNNTVCCRDSLRQEKLKELKNEEH